MTLKETYSNKESLTGVGRVYIELAVDTLLLTGVRGWDPPSHHGGLERKILRLGRGDRR